MDDKAFRTSAREMIDYVIDYLENNRERPAYPSVEPGYLKKLLPSGAPEDAETWEDVKKDLEGIIMSGLSNWQSPQFHAYLSIGISYPSILGSILTDGLGILAFSWTACPVGTELEMIIMNWLAQMLGLPKDFHYHPEGKGGGTLQGSASESTLIALLSARKAVVTKLQQKDPTLTKGNIVDKLVCYTSDEAHCSVPKAALYGFVEMRILPTDEKGALRGPVLKAAIEKDIKAGLVPFFMCATIGSTSTCAVDDLCELGPICNQYDIWLHVDAAYAGSACVCPEFWYLLDGVKYVTTFNFDPHKWLRINYECSAMWVKDTDLISEAYQVNPTYLEHHREVNKMPEFRHWGIPLGRRFRSLKVWFVLRLFGVKGLQEAIRKDVRLAKQFAELVKQDSRFEMFREVIFGIVSFRLKGSNEANVSLCRKINLDRRIHIVGSNAKGTYFLRFAICAINTEDSDVTYGWKVIQEVTDKMTCVANGNGHLI